MIYQFWNLWKNKTGLERKAIEVIQIGKDIILKNIPKKEIVSIYVKGSFVRRELLKTSDVDLVTILRSNRYLKKLDKLDEHFKNKFVPKLEMSSISLWEIKNNKHFQKLDKPRAKPDRFVKYIKFYKLIYGEPLDIKIAKIRSDQENLENLIKAFNETFIPLYEGGKMGFRDIVKQVFWLTDLEQRVKGVEPDHSFQNIAKSVKDKDHIVYLALKFRNKKIKNAKARRHFIIKLKRSLELLENS